MRRIAPSDPIRRAARIPWLLLLLAPGCRDGREGDAPSSSASLVAAVPLDPRTAGADAAIRDGLNTIINRESIRYQPLTYEYDEDLLAILDRAEARGAGREEAADTPRAMPRLTEAEEAEHFRETIRRWSARTRRGLRATLDPLLAEVAARKPGGPAFHPDFHKRFAAEFDQLIALEVAEIRERRNRAIHEQAAPLLDRYRAEFPALVAAQRAILDQPPYNLVMSAAPPP